MENFSGIEKQNLLPAVKLTVYVGGEERVAHQPLFEKVLQILRQVGISGATVTKGAMSYGLKRRIHSLMNEITMENLPLIIEAIDEREKIVAAANSISELLGEHGLVEMHPTNILQRK
jgi:PII-like signaling protein